MSTRLLTTSETARKLGRSVRTVARLAESGDLPHVHKLPGIRGAYLFDPVVVDMFARRVIRDRGVLLGREAAS